MAFRLYVGGLPADLSHSNVAQWVTVMTNIAPVTKQIVRKCHQSTLVAAFVGFGTEEDMLQALVLLRRSPWYGNYKLNVSISKDSKRVNTGNAAGPPPPPPAPPAAPATVQKVPAAPATSSSSTVVSQGVQCDVLPVVSQGVQCDALPAPAQGSVVSQGVQCDVLPAPAQGSVVSQGQQCEPVYCPHCGHACMPEELKPETSPATLSPLPPTEAAQSPTECPSETESAPTVLVDPNKTKEEVELEKQITMAKQELGEIKEELDA